MTGAEILLGSSIVAGKEALKKVIDAICNMSQGALKNSLRGVLKERNISQLFTQIAKVRKVKTLGQLANPLLTKRDNVQ